MNTTTIQVQFPGYDPVACDLTDHSDCDVFENIDSVRAVEILTNTLAGDADENGWISATVHETGEEFQIRAVTPPEVSDIESSYNSDGNHEASASRTIDGKDYFVQCNGFSSCGEADYSNTRSNPFDQYDDAERFAAFEELVSEVHSIIRRKWNYDGSNWSEPVDDPGVELANDTDDDHPIEVRWTRFHGGNVVGYARDEAEAEAWISWTNQGTDCVCGCYKFSEVESDEESECE